MIAHLNQLKCEEADISEGIQPCGGGVRVKNLPLSQIKARWGYQLTMSSETGMHTGINPVSSRGPTLREMCPKHSALKGEVSED